MEYIWEERRVGRLTVRVGQDPWPDDPDEHDEDCFIIGLDGRNFWRPRGWWKHSADFLQFVRPDKREDEREDHGPFLSGPRETVQPERYDARYREAYLEKCSNALEQLLGAAGEDVTYSDTDAVVQAEDALYNRVYAFERWQEYDQAHAEWACYVVNVLNYGGGTVKLTLGDIYTEPPEDRWGDPVEPKAFALVRKANVPDVEGAVKHLMESWERYLDGEIARYEVVDEEEDDVLESCGGWHGKEAALQAGINEAEARLRWEEERGLQRGTGEGQQTGGPERQEAEADVEAPP